MSKSILINSCTEYASIALLQRISSGTLGDFITLNGQSYKMADQDKAKGYDRIRACRKTTGDLGRETILSQLGQPTLAFQGDPSNSVIRVCLYRFYEDPQIASAKASSIRQAIGASTASVYSKNKVVRMDLSFAGHSDEITAVSTISNAIDFLWSMRPLF